MKQIIVSGLSGMVGTRFQKLYSNKYAMANLDLTNGVNITDAGSVDNFFEDHPAQAVLHLAAFTNVSAAHEQTDDKDGPCYQVNVIGTQNITQAAGKFGVYLIHVSTDFIFDGTQDTPYTELDSPHPIEWYGQTKYWAEETVRSANLPHIILRLAYPYQANPSRPDFLANIIHKLTDNTLLPQFIDHWITPTFTDDICQVFDYCLEHQPTGLYHAVGSSSHSDYEIATLVKHALKLPGAIDTGYLADYLKTINRPYQRSLKISNRKLQNDFNLPMMTFEEGLQTIRTSQD